jgi:hypothetical protein
MAKDKAKGKGKAKAPDADASDAIRLSAHPRARRAIALAKGWGGLGAFGLVLMLSLQAGLPLADAMLRGMLGGIAGYVLGWMIAVTAWRQIALAEVERLRRDIVAEIERHAAPADGRAADTELRARA